MISKRYHKSQPVRQYTRDDLQELMDYLKETYVLYYLKQAEKPPQPLSSLSKSTGISERSLRSYIKQLATNPDYNPKDHHEGINRAMSPRLEEKLLMQIEMNYILPGFFFNNKILKELALGL